jgi:hypothetical protein
MRFKKISWYQTGMISLMGLVLFGMVMIEEEREMYRLSRLGYTTIVVLDKKKVDDLIVIDRLKKKSIAKIPIDSLRLLCSKIQKIKINRDTCHVLTVFWNDSTHLQKIITLLDVLQIEHLHRFGIIPNERIMLIDFRFPEDEVEIFSVGSSIPRYALLGTKPKSFQENMVDLLVTNHIWLWSFFLILCIRLILTIKKIS